MTTVVKIIIVLFLGQLFQGQNTFAQNYQFDNGKWLIGKAFERQKVYTVDGKFTFIRPYKIDSIIDISNSFCIPPFGDAHTHNLDGSYGLKEMITNYLNEGVFYVQVLANNGKNAVSIRPALNRSKKIDVTYTNGFLTTTYGHGFYPYEPLAMGIYSPYLQYKYVDSVKKSRLVENISYYFLDNVQDVDKKWEAIMKYQPDNIKIGLLDAANYELKRKKETVGDNGLSPEVAEYVVKKAHLSGLRVFAHVETVEDFRLCVKIGVDVVAHLPGYGWDGDLKTADKFCMTTADINLCKKSGIGIIPTLCVDGVTKYDSLGNPSFDSTKFANKLKYQKQTVKKLYKERIAIGLGADYYGKTVEPEIDYLLKYKILSPKEIIFLWGKSTSQMIFPNRKIGEIREGFEASFLVLSNNPFKNFETTKDIKLKVKEGKIIRYN
ncbi:MAG: hypothetical protein WKF85_10190 [Chitinophagaceae bacterium]